MPFANNYENEKPKVARNDFNIEEVWNPVCCHGNKTVKLVICGAHLVESYCKESNISDTNLDKIYFFIIFDQNLVENTMQI